jgi:hypothetical protein
VLVALRIAPETTVAKELDVAALTAVLGPGFVAAALSLAHPAGLQDLPFAAIVTLHQLADTGVSAAPVLLRTGVATPEGTLARRALAGVDALSALADVPAETAGDAG